ncbi:diacylglycerol kinase family protein [Flavobacteriaceae sp. LMIT009]
MADEKWFVIINPTSGNGKAKKLWPKIKSLLELNDFSFEFAFTESAEHNVKLVYNSVNQGFKNFICVGGDGTIHNTVNGIITQNRFESKELSLGVIPVGTGNDWIKTHNIPRDVEQAILTIKNGETALQDVGKIEFLSVQRDPVFFNNLAGVGFDGYVVSKVGKYKHLGSASYLIGALMGLFSFKNFKVEIEANNEIIKTSSLMVLVGLCQYSGGGMQLTDYSNYNNSFFDITIAKQFSKLDVLLNTHKLYNGMIKSYRKVENLSSDQVIIRIPQGLKPFIQADGELIGMGDIKVSLIPSALSFYK